MKSIGKQIRKKQSYVGEYAYCTVGEILNYSESPCPSGDGGLGLEYIDQRFYCTYTMWPEINYSGIWNAGCG